jgi:hypothetical protein
LWFGIGSTVWVDFVFNACTQHVNEQINCNALLKNPADESKLLKFTYALKRIKPEWPEGEDMLSLYRICGILYLASGIWCVFQPALAAGFLGFELVESLAKAEFFSVYGGLQTGLGLAMLFTSLQSRYVEAGLYYSAVFSVTLALFRLISFMIFGWAEALLMMLIIELLIALILVLGWRKSKAVAGQDAVHHR